MKKKDLGSTTQLEKYEKARKKEKVFGIIVVTLLIIFICVGLFHSSNSNEDKEVLTTPENMCSRIQASPSWAIGTGEIIKTGYINFGNESLNVVEEELIPLRMYFLYHPNCVWCQKQINEFGSTWEIYKESGYTIDCSNV